MTLLNKLDFSFGRSLPLILQAEASECGLACLAVVAAYYGNWVDLADLRGRFAISEMGTTLKELMNCAENLQLNTRPLKLELADIFKLRLPCILHWNFNHFVVLKSASARSVTIYDPALGERQISFGALSNSFTGVALEVWPDDGFERKTRSPAPSLRSLMGKVTGLSRSCFQIFILAIAIEVFSLVSPFYLQWVMDGVIISADRDLLITLSAGFLLLMVLQQAVTAIRTLVLMYLGTTLNVQWRANAFSHLLRLPNQYFEKRHLGDVVSRFGSIDLIQRTLTTSFLEAVLDGLMSALTLGIMFAYSRELTLTIVATTLLYALSRAAWYQPLRSATSEQIVHAARQQSHFLESIRGIKTIKLFQRQEERRGAWLSLFVAQTNADLRTQKLQLIYKTFNGLLFGAANVFIIFLGARLILDGNFTVGGLVAFYSYKNQFDSRSCALIDKFFEVKMLQLQGERLADIIFTTPEESLPTLSEKIEAERSFDLSIRNLRYRYSDNQPFIIDNVSFDIPFGRSVAIVGASGCGKSTLINVLLGLLPLAEGEIFIGGRSITQFGIAQLRRLVGTVLQDDVLFAGSIGDNITFFDPEPNWTWMKTCSEMSAIAKDIDAMPMRYNTLVGDMGTVLSGGQKQRILLARALYKRPRILLLDEATSHLDVVKEREVNESIRSLTMTRVIVAHRPETIASADRIIVIKSGKVLKDFAVHPGHMVRA